MAKTLSKYYGLRTMRSTMRGAFLPPNGPPFPPCPWRSHEDAEEYFMAPFFAEVT